MVWGWYCWSPLGSKASCPCQLVTSSPMTLSAAKPWSFIQTLRYFVPSWTPFKLPYGMTEERWNLWTPAKPPEPSVAALYQSSFTANQYTLQVCCKWAEGAYWIFAIPQAQVLRSWKSIWHHHPIPDKWMIMYKNEIWWLNMKWLLALHFLYRGSTNKINLHADGTWSLFGY